MGRRRTCVASQSGYFADANEFLNKMLLLPMYQLSNVKNTAGNVLDLVFVSEIHDVKLDVDPNTIIDADQQDECHVPYEITIDYCSKQSIAKIIDNAPAFCFRRGNYERMQQQLQSVNFAHEFKIQTIDVAFEFFSI